MVSTQPNPIDPGFIPTIFHLKSRNHIHLRFNYVHGVLSAQPNWSWLHTQQSLTWSHETMFTCASTVYMYFCNLSTELTLPPLVATSLLNHFEDFVKNFEFQHVSHWLVLCSYRLFTGTVGSWNNLSFNTSVTNPFSVPTDSHLQELPDPGTTWEQTLSIFNKISLNDLPLLISELHFMSLFVQLLNRNQTFPQAWNNSDILQSPKTNWCLQHYVTHARNIKSSVVH